MLSVCAHDLTMFVGVSAASGQGMDEFFVAVEKAAQEYHEFYRPELERRKVKVKAEEKKLREESLQKLKKDIVEEEGGSHAEAAKADEDGDAKGSGEEAEYNDLMKWIKSVKKEEEDATKEKQ